MKYMTNREKSESVTSKNKKCTCTPTEKEETRNSRINGLDFPNGWTRKKLSTGVCYAVWEPF